MINHSSIPTIGFPFVGDTVAGSHVSTLLLMQELQQFGFNAIALVHDNGPLTDHLTNKGVEFLQTGLPYLDYGKSGIKALGRSLSIAPKIAYFVRQNDIALIHANDGRMIASWTFSALLARRPVIVHARQPWQKSRMAYVCFRVASGRIAISSYVHDSMPDKIRRDTTLIANPFAKHVIDQTGDVADISETTELPRERVIVFIGTLMERKRPSVFLAAAAEIAKFTNCKFVLLGRETEILPELKRQVTDLGLDDCVTFAGFRDDVLDLMPGYDLLIAPAINEAHGRVLIEAMLGRVPVIAADSGGHREIIQDCKTGLLVPPDNPAAFSTAARRLLKEDKFRKTIVQNAWSWASSTFSPQRHAQEIAEVYRNTLKHGSTHVR